MNRFRAPARGCLALAAAVAGCASRPPLAVQRYALAVPTAPPRAGARRAPRRASSRPDEPAFLEPSLVYRVGGGRVEVDPYASLAAPPRSLLTSAIRAYLVRQPA